MEGLIFHCCGHTSFQQRWKEKPFTVLLRPPKDDPIRIEPVVNFLVYVEDQNPSIKTKELSFAFKDNAFSSVRILPIFKRFE